VTVTPDPVDVLVVGAGPTGLALAAQLAAFGTPFRIVDREPDPVHESRALAVQPRTLEVLAGLGIAQRLIERGNPAARLHLHAGDRTTELPLFDIGVDDTAFPFLLFVSQAETEAVLNTHLADEGVVVERGVELVSLHDDPAADHVACQLRDHGGRIEHLTARYVVGCDGAHSHVRASAGIEFPGSAYPQTFVLADLPADGLDPTAVHAYLAPVGMLFFFPLDHPAPWRLLAMRPHDPRSSTGEVEPPGLADLQALADTYTAGSVELGPPVWSTYFRIHHRHAHTYRSGRVFLAGDAAHIHSPAGAQGMNTGIQDAWNLGWKLALVAQGIAEPALLDTYQTEREPVGRDVLAFTDRAFRIATTTNAAARFARTRIAPHLLAAAARFRRGRATVLRTVAQLAITYRHSALSHDATRPPRRAPRAGDRLPDAPVETGGHTSTVHRALAAPRFHALLVGPTGAWPATTVTPLAQHYAGVAGLHRLDLRPGDGVIHDPARLAHKRLGLTRPGESATYLVRPDGHIAYRSAGASPDGLRAYLDHWLLGTARAGTGT
jgi:2-polyprenyl-6-methoxyphenol hydroxylase-like FAD-dependent oxidoreductase